MKLWLLRPVDGVNLWEPWYDKAFGFVVRTENEEEARSIAAGECGDEGREAWLSSAFSTCIELTADGEALVMRDFAAA